MFVVHFTTWIVIELKMWVMMGNMIFGSMFGLGGCGNMLVMHDEDRVQSARHYIKSTMMSLVIINIYPR